MVTILGQSNPQEESLIRGAHVNTILGSIELRRKKKETRNQDEGGENPISI